MLLKLETGKKLSRVIFGLIFFSSCNQEAPPNVHKNDVIEGTVFMSRDSINQLIDKAISLNDTMAYNKVASYFLLNNLGKEFFYNALVMANKYDNAEASFHVYNIIAYSTDKSPYQALMKMDNRTKNLALYYLLKSYELGFPSAKFEVEEIFKGSDIPKSISIQIK